MKKVYEILKENCDAIYEALPDELHYSEQDNTKMQKKRMMVIVPDLELNGAQTVLRELLDVILNMDSGYDIFIIASQDGPYREIYQRMGITVAIRQYVVATEQFKKVLQNWFDITLINTAACYSYIYYYINTDARVLWWLHETKNQLATMMDNFPNPNLLSQNIMICGVTKAVVRGLYEMFSYNIGLLPMPVKDCRHEKNVIANGQSGDKVTFLLPAAFTYIKGQDILLQAVAALPDEYRNRSQFVLCGYKLEKQEEYYNAVKEIAQKIDNVIWKGQLSREEVYELYKGSDCVLAPSRVDATPTTVIEAMMFGKYTIVSDAAGISEYMQDCVNGFVFPSENIQELMKRIMIVIKERDNLGFIADAGRKLYEENFSTEHIAAIMEEII